MGKKYKLNVNGAPASLVNINGAPWQGNMKIDGVEVSYEDTPAPPSVTYVPRDPTIWRFSQSSELPRIFNGGGGYPLPYQILGPVIGRVKGVQSGWVNDGIGDTVPFILASGSRTYAGCHVTYGPLYPSSFGVDVNSTSLLNYLVRNGKGVSGTIKTEHAAEAV